MPFEQLEEKCVFQHAVEFADLVWQCFDGWPSIVQRTIGEQLVRAADSVGANIAEAAGRFHPGEVRNFFYYARGSLFESKFWLRRACRRKQINDEELAKFHEMIDQLASEINGCVAFQRTREKKPVRRILHPSVSPPNNPTTQQPD